MKKLLLITLLCSCAFADDFYVSPDDGASVSVFGGQQFRLADFSKVTGQALLQRLAPEAAEVIP